MSPFQSDGNASDDEADLEDTEDQQDRSQRLAKPTFEEYVNKYVLTKCMLLTLLSTQQNNKTLKYYFFLPSCFITQ